MRVLVDTSAWIDFFRKRDSSAAAQLEDLIRQEVEICTCGVVAAEFLQGVRPAKGIPSLERQFLEMDWLRPREPETYLAAAHLYRKLRGKGVTVRSTIDCLIARLAEEHHAYLLFNDRDLERIHSSGLCSFQTIPFH